MGIMAACLDAVLPYVHQRKQFGQPIGEFQLMQGKLADIYATFSACRAYVYAVGQALDRGETTRKDAAGAILYAAEKATWMAGEAIQALGKLRSADTDGVSALGMILLSESLFGASREEQVRIDAGTALFRIGGTEAMSYLHRGKGASRSTVREHCEALLRMRGRG